MSQTRNYRIGQSHSGKQMYLSLFELNELKRVLSTDSVCYDSHMQYILCTSLYIFCGIYIFIVNEIVQL